MAPRRKSQESLPIEKLLTIKQAASILDVSPKKVGRLIKNGEIAVVKVGKRHRITIRELQDFIERNSKPSLAFAVSKLRAGQKSQGNRTDHWQRSGYISTVQFK